jgi:hypothetical protein
MKPMNWFRWDTPSDDGRLTKDKADSQSEVTTVALVLGIPLFILVCFAVWVWA